MYSTIYIYILCCIFLLPIYLLCIYINHCHCEIVAFGSKLSPKEHNIYLIIMKVTLSVSLRLLTLLVTWRKVFYKISSRHNVWRFQGPAASPGVHQSNSPTDLGLYKSFTLQHWRSALGSLGLSSSIQCLASVLVFHHDSSDVTLKYCKVFYLKALWPLAPHS